MRLVFSCHILTITFISYFIISNGEVNPLNVKVTTDAIPVVGRSNVNLASCTASTSQSQAEVSWNLGVLSDSVKELKNTVEKPENMYTVTSSLIGVPTVNMDQQNVQCVVRHLTLKEELVIDHKMVVHYPPQLVYVTPLPSGDGFQCETDANPRAIFSWKRMNQTIQNNGIKIKGNKLYFLQLTSDLNGLYICEAFNEYGTGTGSLYWQKGGFHTEL